MASSGTRPDGGPDDEALVALVSGLSLEQRRAFASALAPPGSAPSDTDTSSVPTRTEDRIRPGTSLLPTGKGRLWKSTTVTMFMLLALGIAYLNKELLVRPSVAMSDVTYKSNVTTSDAKDKSNDGYVRPPVLYGHVHMAKTGGTELNGQLSVHFERVCGHKGYSYDAIQTNLRFNRSSHNILSQHDSISLVSKTYNRGRVPPKVMDEIGYDDCDYVSMEDSWKFWTARFQHWDQPLELHVPCRNPLDHLMSQCNYRERNFNCNGNLTSEIESCLLFLDRFSKELETSFDNIRLKCFDFRRSFTDYVDYMGERLQRRRVEARYVHRETNRPRNKSEECVWNRPDVREAAESHLLKWDYYDYCGRCLGSEDDLFHD